MAPKTYELPIVEEEDLVRGRLAMTASVDGFEPNTPLKEALGFLAERYGLDIKIDQPAFNNAGRDGIESHGVELPQMTGVPLSSILSKVLAQANAEYTIRKRVIWIVPTPAKKK